LSCFSSFGQANAAVACTVMLKEHNAASSGCGLSTHSRFIRYPAPMTQDPPGSAGAGTLQHGRWFEFHLAAPAELTAGGCAVEPLTGVAPNFRSRSTVPFQYARGTRLRSTLPFGAMFDAISKAVCPAVVFALRLAPFSTRN